MHYEKLNEVDIVKSMSDSGYVLGVDETGDIKRIPRSTLGKESKTVYVDIPATIIDGNNMRISDNPLTQEQLTEICDLQLTGVTVLLRTRLSQEDVDDTNKAPTPSNYMILVPAYAQQAVGTAHAYRMCWVGFEWTSNNTLTGIRYKAVKSSEDAEWKQWVGAKAL